MTLNLTRRRHLARFLAVSATPRRAPVAALAALFLGACGDKPAPQSEFVLLDASRKTTQDFAGKVMLVNFWATSCVSCVAEMPDIAKLYTELSPQGFDVVAVAMQYDPPAFVVNFAQTRKLPFKVAIDNTGAIAKAWDNVTVTPTSFLVNKHGQIVKTFVGKPDFANLRTQVTQLLAQA